ncbi:hypothetical protein MNBD_ALPHA08-370 [hydrothermal vent metagenome]|uniref:Thioredoxin domain-containing protein n=1 Tax=hydrothermal vent metagenome TaxID=652676 RepID=A0A3B0RHA0_9ZZZZ
MLSRLKTLGISLALLITMLVPAMGQTTQFNPEQRKEMGEIVRQYLMTNPEVLRDAFRELERKDAIAKAAGEKAAVQSMASDIFRFKGDHVVGNPDGDVTVVEFMDYNCPYCKRALVDVEKLIENDKNVRVVMKEFPILGESSTFASRAAIASRAQGKYWEFHLALMRKRGSATEASVLKAAKQVGLDVAKLRKDMDAPEVSEIIQRNYAIAQALNINGTPAFVIAENILAGAVGYDALTSAVTKVRENGGCSFC